MKNLVVCGCSYMSSSFHKYQFIKGNDWPEYDKFLETKLNKKLRNEILDLKYEHNLHFADLFAIDKKLNYTNLAQGGASNFAIRMQIDQAISCNPDFMIIGATVSGRFEIPLGKFDHTKLIDNYLDISEINVCNSNNETFQQSIEFSTNINLINQNPDIHTAYKYYHSYLYDVDVDDFKNYYIIQSGLRLIESLQIPYIFIPGPLRKFDWSGFNCWPDEYKQPWDFNEVYYASGNHLPERIHKILLGTLNKITRDWK